MDLESILLTAAGIVSAIGVLFVALRKVSGFFRRSVHLFDEILGKEGYGGLPDTPGMSARIAAIEAELRPNGGSSLRDAVNRLEVWTSEHNGLHTELDARFIKPSN